MSQITKKALAAAMIELLEEHTLEKITIKDITDKCGLNRNTFYYHFNDMYDLLNYIFLCEADRIIIEDANYETWQNVFIRLTDYILQHKKMIIHVYNSLSKEHLESYLFSVSDKLLVDIVKQQAEGMRVTEENIKFLADFYKFALVGILFEWIRGGLKEEPQAYIPKIEKICEGHIKEALQRLEEK